MILLNHPKRKTVIVERAENKHSGFVFLFSTRVVLRERLFPLRQSGPASLVPPERLAVLTVLVHCDGLDPVVGRPDVAVPVRGFQIRLEQIGRGTPGGPVHLSPVHHPA